jgi:hypothetical protein
MAPRAAKPRLYTTFFRQPPRAGRNRTAICETCLVTFGAANFSYSDGLDGIRNLPRLSSFSFRMRLISRARAMKLCKSCSFEAITASCCRRSFLLFIRQDSDWWFRSSRPARNSDNSRRDRMSVRRRFEPGTGREKNPSLHRGVCHAVVVLPHTLNGVTRRAHFPRQKEVAQTLGMLRHLRSKKRPGLARAPAAPSRSLIFLAVPA